MQILPCPHCLLAKQGWRCNSSGWKLFPRTSTNSRLNVNLEQMGATAEFSTIFTGTTFGAQAAFRRQRSSKGAWISYQSMKPTLFLFGFSLFFSPQFVKAWNQVFTPETKRNSWLRWNFPSSCLNQKAFWGQAWSRRENWNILLSHLFKLSNWKLVGLKTEIWNTKCKKLWNCCSGIELLLSKRNPKVLKDKSESWCSERGVKAWSRGFAIDRPVQLLDRTQCVKIVRQ